jgi:glycosyltransferase involved in cell wall biosynthesis
LPIGKKKIPYVVTIHDLGFKKFPHMARLVERSYFETAMRFVKYAADIIIVDSNAIKNDLINFYQIKEKKIKVIPLGVDKYYEKKDSRQYYQKLENKLDIKNKQTILLNSIHSPRKNFSLIEKAWSLIRSKFPDATLLVTGIGRQLSKNTNILNLGFVSKRKLRALYQMVDLFVYPSLYEGFGLPILEAMSARCLVAASRIPAIKEFGLDDSCLFNPYNYQQAAEIIIHSLERRDTSSILDKNYYLASQYSWDKTAKMTAKLYFSLTT